MQGFEALDFDGFHRRDLPGRLAAGNGTVAAADLADTAPIAFVIKGRKGGYTYAVADGTVKVLAGIETAKAVVQLDPTDWQDLVYELRSAFGLLYAGRLEFPRGGFEHLERWWPAMRAMFNGRPIYDESSLDLRDIDGSPLDLGKSFELDDDTDAMAHFLRSAGYLHLTSVYTTEEIERFSAEVDRISALAEAGDGHSWWANDASGSQALCRLTYVNDLSPHLAQIHLDERAIRIAALSGEQLECSPDRMEGHSVVIKVPEAVDGLADLPWHVDCGLGGHPLMCPAILIGIQLDDASEESGRLLVRAGSWGSSCHMRKLDGVPGRLEVALNAQAGDCTVHFSDNLHAAPPPTGKKPARRALYINYFSPRLFEHVGPGEAYNDVLGRGDDGVVPSVDDVLGR
jgi:ectoine hydroxylase-related dioxygenase (phytanoyl-CoA dioxygenase family)